MHDTGWRKLLRRPWGARLGHLGLHLLDDRVILKLELLALSAFGSWCKEIKHCQVGLQRQEAVVALLAESTAKQLRDLAKAGACGHIQQAAGQSILDVDINVWSWSNSQHSAVSCSH